MSEERKFKRKCVVCGGYFPKKMLYRFTFDGLKTVVNNKNEVQGRSFYICKDAECLKKCLKSKVLSKYTKLNHTKSVMEFITHILNHINY